MAARLAKMMEKEAVKRKGRYRQNPANLPGFDLGESRVKAAGQVNVSPRLVSSAIKLLRDGCSELIATVESGALAVSTAAALAGPPCGPRVRRLQRLVRERLGDCVAAPAAG